VPRPPPPDHPLLFTPEESRRPPRLFGLPPSDWRAPRLADLPQDWNLHPRVSIDCETRDEKLRVLGPGVRRGAYMVGYSFCPEGGRGWYVPLAHEGGDNVEDPAQALQYLRDQAKNYRGEIVGARLDYDLDFMAEAGVVFHPDCRFLDVQVAEPLIDELQFSYSLDNILERHGLPKKDESLLRKAAKAYEVDPKVGLWRLPARYVGPYAEGDAEKPLRLLRKQEVLLERDGLQRVWKQGQLILPILLKMRRRGVAVDFDQLDRVERFSLAEEAKAWGFVARETSISIAVGDGSKKDALLRVFQAIGVDVGKTATGQPSITKEWMEGLKHPVATAVRRARKMAHLRTTFVNQVREHAVNGRVHATFNQTRMESADGAGDVGVAFGRLSCSDPNLQNQPARDPELGPMWRKVYVPDEGKQWASLDFSQQEPGGMLHLACLSGPGTRYFIGDRAHASALQMAERKRRDPTVDYHTMFTSFVHGPHVLLMDKKSKELKVIRDPCKNIFLGVCYGSGGAKVCNTIGLPTEWKQKRDGKWIEIAGAEGQAILDKVDANVPWLRATQQALSKAAKDRGWVKTPFGRRLHFERDRNGEYDFTYKAMNRAVQGMAAEQTFESMIVLDAMGAPIQIQVHDELGLSVEDRPEAERYARAMEETYPLTVPNRVDVEIGPSWGEAK
jgi:DNA polymerase I-like protein with 3'-5' exonuclease and polymerase domains